MDNNMRMRVGVVLVLAVGFLMAAAAKNRNYSDQLKHRPRPREIRGFKLEKVGTAVGFGKRGDPAKNPRYDRIISILLRNSARSNSEEEVLPTKLRSNPILMGKLMQLLLDVQQNDAPTMIAVPESERIISLL